MPMLKGNTGNRIKAGAAPGMPGAGFLLPPGIPGVDSGDGNRGREPGADFHRGRFPPPIPAPGIPGVDSGGGNRGRKSGAGFDLGGIFSCQFFKTVNGVGFQGLTPWMDLIGTCR